MPNVSPLHELALLYLAAVQGADDRLSYAEREAVTDTLHLRYAYLDRAEVQNVVLEVFASHDVDTLHDAARGVISVLGGILSDQEKQNVLEDLIRITRADGVVLERERRLLRAVASSWGVEARVDEGAWRREDTDVASWDALHHLAFIYLVLAHAPDSDFSEEERQLILKKLHQWSPSHAEHAILEVLERAIVRYAQGPDPRMFTASVEAVKSALPAAERKAALHDLIQIANADGIFLDSEEDLLNELVAAWDLDALADYGQEEEG